jgi:hypothetical protein
MGNSRHDGAVTALGPITPARPPNDNARMQAGRRTVGKQEYSANLACAGIECKWSPCIRCVGELLRRIGWPA